MADVAFIGTGLLGSAMVEGMLKRGDSVTVWNRTESKARALEAAGARVAASPSREGVSLPAAMVSAPRRRDAACHAGSAARKSRRTTMTANPTPSRATFTWNPGWGSASRAGPMGISGEATAATTNASIAPTRLGPVTRAMARRKS